MAKQTSILQPDDSLEILVAGNSSSTYRKTIRQIINNYKSQINNNANVFMFIPWSASGHTYDYYYIYGFQIYDEITDVYLRNDVASGYTNSLYILPKNNNVSQTMERITSEAYYINENTLNTGYSLALRNVDQYDSEIYYGFWYSWVDDLSLPNIIYVDISNITIYRNGIAPSPSSSWVSVQSITGNGLTIPLVTLTSDSINGGDPVSNGTISSFTNQPSNDNNVKYLVDLSISAVSNDITVDYTIPTITKGSYISVKLFGKIGELPACNEDDDVIEDLDPIESSKDIYSLPGGTYYFCIRTITSDGLKLTSNALSIEIGDPVPEDLKPYVKLINDITGYTYDGMGGFTMYDYTIASDGTNPNYDPYCRNYSWHNQHWAGPGQSQPVITDSNFDTATILPFGIMDVNVDTSTFTITSNTVASPMIFSTRYQQYGHRYYQGSYFYGYPCSSNSINVGTYSSTIITQGYNNGDTSVSFSSQYLTTTFDCVKWVAQNFRNINLYVDGILWSKANNTN